MAKNLLFMIVALALAGCGGSEPAGVGGSGGSAGHGGGAGHGGTGGTGGLGGEGGGEGGGGSECAAGEIRVLGSCRDACDPETNLRDDGTACEDGQRCALLGHEGGEPYGACMPESGGGTRGAGCADDTECERDHVCLGTDTGGRCVPRCDPDGSAGCGAGLRCMDVEVDGGTIGVCAPTTCENDDDCAEDQVCATWTRPGGWVDTACVFAAGEATRGEPCTADGDCASGACIEELGVCHGVCKTSEDCPDDGVCVLYPIESGEEIVWLPTCISDCVKDSDCGPGLTCAWYDTRQENTRTACVPTRGDKPAGAPCTTFEECATGICQLSHDFTTGYCQGGCAGAEDCAEGTECADILYRSAGRDYEWDTADDWETYPSCRGPKCVSSKECADGWACRPDFEMVDGEFSIVHRCLPPVGTGTTGDRCPSMCATGSCVQTPENPVEDCANGIDDDADGDVDCADLGCRWWCGREDDCANGVDDDQDGFGDCEDLDCEAFCTTERCANGQDDDGNGLADCDDPGCFWECHEFDQCYDRKDQDDDGRIDCDDPDCCMIDWMDECRGKAACTETVCDDGLDDDGDGLVDCADYECWNREGCMEQNCGDGLDDDGDGQVDCADFNDCALAEECVERDCANGLDDNGDGRVDCFDPECAEAPGCSESNCAGKDCCTNGLDDDGDGRTDCQDGNCAMTEACGETFCTGGDCCSDGLDSDGDGDVDCADRDCKLTPECVEGGGYDEWTCDNGEDDDGDGLSDCDDPDCAGVWGCKVCYEPCKVDDDCLSGRCVMGAGLDVPPFAGTFVYVGTCMPE